MKKEATRTVRIFALSSFLNDMGSDMISPIWPLFVTIALKANIAMLGFLDGIGEAIVSVSQAGGGWLSDKLKKRKLFIWFGYLFPFLSRIGYALAKTWQHLFPFRIIDRAGKIRDPPRDAIIADVTKHKERGRAFGFLEAMDSLGAVFGILICIALLAFGISYRNLLVLAALPSLVSVILIFIFIKEKKPKKISYSFKLKNLDRNFKFFLLLSSFFTIASFSYSFLLLAAKEFGLALLTLPILYLIFTAISSLFSVPFGRLSDKIGRKKVMLIAYILWAYVCISFIFWHNSAAIIIAIFVYGLHLGALKPVQKTFIAELSPRKYRASGIGIFRFVTGLCALPASAIAGLLWAKFGTTAPFYFSLLLTAFSTFLLLFLREKL